MDKYAAARLFGLRVAEEKLDALARVERHVENPTIKILGSLPSEYLDMTPDERAAERAMLEKAIDEFQPTDIAETEIYKAGEDISRAAEKAMPVAPGWEDSVTVNVMGGLGSFLSGLAAYKLGGRTVAGGTFVEMGVGEQAQTAMAFDKAERAAGRPGLSPEQLAGWSILGAIPGATDLSVLEAAFGALRGPSSLPPPPSPSP